MHMNKRIITVLLILLIPIISVSSYCLGIHQSNDTPDTPDTPDFATNTEAAPVNKGSNWDSDLSNVREFVSQQQSQQASVAEDSVYVTPHGEKYHTKNCRYIQNSTPSKISVSDAIDEGYTACKVCKPNR